MRKVRKKFSGIVMSLVATLVLFGSAVPVAGQDEEVKNILLTNGDGLLQGLRNVGCDTSWLSEVMDQNGVTVEQLNHLHAGHPPFTLRVHPPLTCVNRAPEAIRLATIEKIGEEVRLMTANSVPTRTSPASPSVPSSLKPQPTTPATFNAEDEKVVAEREAHNASNRKLAAENKQLQFDMEKARRSSVFQIRSLVLATFFLLVLIPVFSRITSRAKANKIKRLEAEIVAMQKESQRVLLNARSEANDRLARSQKETTDVRQEFAALSARLMPERIVTVDGTTFTHDRSGYDEDTGEWVDRYNCGEPRCSGRGIKRKNLADHVSERHSEVAVAGSGIEGRTTGGALLAAMKQEPV